MKTSIVSIGIDIGKHALDVHRLPAGTHQHYANDADGITALLAGLDDAHAERIVCEPSGGYERALVDALQKAGLPVCMVNARQVRDFARAQGILAKTDRIDAKVLAQYGAVFQPAPTRKKPASDLAAYVARRRQIVAMTTRERLALEHNPPAAIREGIEAHIARLNAERLGLEKAMLEQVEATPASRVKRAILTSCKGIGEITAATLIADLPEIGEASHGQLAALVGIAPFAHDSGHMKGVRRIRGGRGHVRKTLYMATLSAIRCNPDIKEYYQKLRARGKHAKVAIIAAMRKLLATLNALVKNNRMWKEAV